jgi:hypothetical protein
MSTMFSIAAPGPARLTIEGTLILLFSHVVVDYALCAAHTGSLDYCCCCSSH